MKILLEEDFIYLEANHKAKLIVHNCEENCSFCPAAKIKSFQNYGKLNSVFNFSVEELTIYGNVNCSYLETFIKKYKELNPKGKVCLIGCDCNLTQELDLEYSHVIYPNLTEYLKVEPKEFILPATGDSSMLEVFISRYLIRYPNIPIKVSVLDSSDADTEFWSDDKIQEFQKQIDTKFFGI